MARRSLVRLVVCLAATAVSSCDCADFDNCEIVEAKDLAALPDKLSDTGIDGDGVFPYTPAFALWSDGAEKRRFAFIPEGAQIDAADADEWRFPEGTKLWKEFTRDGVKVETRLLQKVGPKDEDWRGAAYIWDASGDEATLSVDGLENAVGTAHDVPAADLCMGCHGGRQSRALGFSALQLSPQPGTTTKDGDMDLSGLIDAGLLAHAPSAPLVVPGDDTARAALGYLHANCSHCHNQERPETTGARCFDPRNELDFSLRAEDLDKLEHARFFATALKGKDDFGGQPFTRGDVDASFGLKLMSHRGPPDLFSPTQMPPLATEDVDDDGVAAVTAFIESL